MGNRHERKDEIFDRTTGHCAYCGKPLEREGNWHIEHIVPASRGGKYIGMSNYLPACPSCNIRKHCRTVDEYREYLPRRVGKRLLEIQSEIEMLAAVSPKQAEKLLGTFDTLLYMCQKADVVFYFDHIKTQEED